MIRRAGHRTGQESVSMKNFKAGTVTRPTEKLNMRTAVGGQKGFTLVEIVIVIVILGIVGGITFQFVALGVQAFKKSRDRKDLYDQGRLAMERMVRELRDGYEVTDCTATSITFRVAHPAAFGVVDEIKYQLNGTDLERVGDPSGTPLTAVLASNVTDFPMFEGTTTGGVIGVTPASTGTVTSGATGMTISHTTGSGSYRLMLVGVSFNNDGYETVTGVTYNGTALTLVGTEATTDDARVEIWRLVAPSTGTHNVVITFSAALLQEAHAGVMTFTNVYQTTPLGTFVSAKHDGSTPATVDIPSASGEIVFGVVASEYDTLTASSGQTEQWNLAVSSTYGAGGTAAGAATTVTMSWDLAAANHWAMGGVSIKPEPATVDCTGGTGVISFDAATPATSCGTCNGVTFQHTVGNGGNRLLVVTVGLEHDPGENTVSGVTYGGQALTQIRGEIAEPGGTEAHAELWYLLNPPSGPANVVVSTGGGAGNVRELHAGAISLEDVAQQAPEANAGSNLVGAGPISTNITTLTDGSWLVDAVTSGNAGTFTPDSGQTEQHDLNSTTSSHAAGTREVATASAAAEQWTHSGANRLAHAVAAFAPASSQSIFPLVTLQLTLSSAEGGTVTLRTKVYLRNVPPT